MSAKAKVALAGSESVVEPSVFLFSVEEGHLVETRRPYAGIQPILFLLIHWSDGKRLLHCKAAKLRMALKTLKLYPLVNRKQEVKRSKIHFLYTMRTFT